MFGISWNEYIVIAIVALIVIGPKELPAVLRAVGQWTAKVRRMAAEFQGQFQEALREAEMADLKKEVDNLHDTARGLTSQFDDPMNFQEATKWEPKPDMKWEPKPDIKPEVPPELEAGTSDDAAKEAGASSATALASEVGPAAPPVAEPSVPAALAAPPAASEHPLPEMAGAAAAPSELPSEGSAPKADEKAGDGGVHA
jgi:sec-independent protein translocase protein TatB